MTRYFFIISGIKEMLKFCLVFSLLIFLFNSCCKHANEPFPKHEFESKLTYNGPNLYGYSYTYRQYFETKKCDIIKESICTRIYERDNWTDPAVNLGDHFSNDTLCTKYPNSLNKSYHLLVDVAEITAAFPWQDDLPAEYKNDKTKYFSDVVQELYVSEILVMRGHYYFYVDRVEWSE